MRSLKRGVCFVLCLLLLIPYGVFANEDIIFEEPPTDQDKVIHIGKDENESSANQTIARSWESKQAKEISAPTETKEITCETIVKKKEAIEKEIKDIKKAREMYRKGQKKKSVLLAFYQTIGNEADLKSVLSCRKKTGAELQTSTVDQQMKKQLLKLSKKLDDPYLVAVANTYTFDVDLKIQKSLEHIELLDLTSYLNRYLKIGKKDRRSIKRLKSKMEAMEERRIYNPKNLTQVSHFTKDEMKKVLSGTELSDCAPYFVECEKNYGINALFIAGIAIHESGWGTSRRAREDNNLTGYGVTSDVAHGINGKSRRNNLLRTARCLKNSYLTEGAKFYEGTSVSAVNVRYCVGNEWAPAVTNYGYELMDRLAKEKGYHEKYNMEE